MTFYQFLLDDFKKKYIYTEKIFDFFKPKDINLLVEYTFLIQRFNGKLDGKIISFHDGEIDNSKPTKRELVQSVSRTVRYCALNNIKSARPFLFLIRRYKNEKDDINWNTKISKTVIQDVNYAYRMLSQETKQTDIKNPVYVVKSICEHWELFWNQELSYTVIADVLFSCEKKKEYSLGIVLFFIIWVDFCLQKMRRRMDE